MKVSLKNVRISFPHLFQPQAPRNGGEGGPKFNAQFIFEKGSENDSLVKAAVAEVSKEKWGANGGKVVASLEASKKCLRDGDNNLNSDGDIRGGFAGNNYVVASSKTRPTVIDRDKSPLVEQDGKPYGGCYVNAIVDVYALDKPGIGKGVFAELKGVQFANDGDAFGGGTPASADDFDDLGNDDLGF